MVRKWWENGGSGGEISVKSVALAIAKRFEKCLIIRSISTGIQVGEKRKLK